MAQIIWTNHLKERLRQRKLDVSTVDRAIRFPDRVEKSHTTDSSKHIKIVGHKQIVAAVKRRGNDWVVTSVWEKPYFGKPHDPRTLLERLIYRFVLWLENRVRRSFKF